MYSGRLNAQLIDREAALPQGLPGQQQGGQPQDPSPFLVEPEPRYLYSTHVYWYPQAPVSDYATASLRLRVPSEFQLTATGSLVNSSVGPDSESPGGRGAEPRFVRTSEYRRRSSGAVSLVSHQPLHSGGPVARRGARGRAIRLRWPHPAAADRPAGRERRSRRDAAHDEPQSATADARRGHPARSTASSSARRRIRISPSPASTTTCRADTVPHSSRSGCQPLPTTPYTWSNDPLALDAAYPLYYLAHEIAHQWWGQAVGWKNYHEQWLSEGLAQYFAVLYAASDRGPDTMHEMLDFMRDSADELHDEGTDLARLPARPRAERRAHLPRDHLQQVGRSSCT